MNEDQLIAVLQGMKAGRKWGVRFKSSGDLVEQCSQSLESLASLVGANDVKRIELMPETITCNGADWRDKPTEPGLWVRVVDDGGVCSYLVDAEDIGDEFWANGCRFYGPIPPDNASGVRV